MAGASQTGGRWLFTRQRQYGDKCQRTRTTFNKKGRKTQKNLSEIHSAFVCQREPSPAVLCLLGTHAGRDFSTRLSSIGPHLSSRRFLVRCLKHALILMLPRRNILLMQPCLLTKSRVLLWSAPPQKPHQGSVWSDTVLHRMVYWHFQGTDSRLQMGPVWPSIFLRFICGVSIIKKNYNWGMNKKMNKK